MLANPDWEFSNPPARLPVVIASRGFHPARLHPTEEK